MIVRDHQKYFWSNVARGDSCWLYQGSRNVHGYGVIQVNGRKWLAHRYCWFISNGEIPDGMCIMHKCDTPLCVNPDHLILGTHADNMSDMATKGRRKGVASGDEHGRAKLTEDDVREIRKSSLSRVALASIYGVRPETISHIVTRRNWSHI